MESNHVPSANPRSWAGALLACGLLALAAGCGPDYKARGTVKGQVKIGSRPLPFGTVMFINKNGISATANVDENGNYEMKDAPVGECQVTVSVPTCPRTPGCGPG